MTLRVSTLQAKFINRIRWLSNDALLTTLATTHKCPLQNSISTAQENKTMENNKAKLLCACRDTRGIDSIVILSMTYYQRSRLLRWRLGWMPNGRPDVPCNNCNNQNHLSRQHVIYCLNAHIRFKVPYVVIDPISFKLNALPKNQPCNLNKRRYWINLWNK
ncbi:hypothetical protein INT45_004043 [Circinella minor]|uniref:Uncharacterized protein n=1 Tax=Circinella minor TaxID=1195481 RepID=A0A8H7S284_9FUNG|nr:hypothetical protein INT45_004043 [Circinella minor]